MSHFWVLNPGAEQEIAQGPSRFAYTTPLKVRRAMLGQRESFSLLTQGEPCAFSFEDLHEARGATALLWSPTAAAQKAARLAGLVVPRAPDMTALHTVSDKCFLHESGLPVLSEHRILRARSDLTLPPKGELRLKRRFGFAGRGQRKVSAPLSADDERYVADSLAQGGLIAEPELADPQVFSLHGIVAEDTLLLGHPCQVHSDAFHAPRAIERATLQPQLTRGLTRLAESCAHAALQRGYFGPFGIDAVLLPDDSLKVIDLNPRFTLGWSVGLDTKRQAALKRLLSL